MKNTSITLRISEEEKLKITELALKRDIPVSQFIREAIRKEIEYGSTKSISSNN